MRAEHGKRGKKERKASRRFPFFCSCPYDLPDSTTIPSPSPVNFTTAHPPSLPHQNHNHQTIKKREGGPHLSSTTPFNSSTPNLPPSPPFSLIPPATSQNQHPKLRLLLHVKQLLLSRHYNHLLPSPSSIYHLHLQPIHNPPRKHDQSHSITTEDHQEKAKVAPIESFYTQPIGLLCSARSLHGVTLDPSLPAIVGTWRLSPFHGSSADRPDVPLLVETPSSGL